MGSLSVPVCTQALSQSPEIQIGRESSHARDKDALTPPPLLCLHSFMQRMTSDFVLLGLPSQNNRFYLYALSSCSIGNEISSALDHPERNLFGQLKCSCDIMI